MATFLQNNDLVCHILSFMAETEEKQSASLVCKNWKQMSDLCPSWRMAKLRLLFCEEERLEVQNDKKWGMSITTLKNIFEHCRHITEFELICEYCRPSWWRHLSAFMPHIRGLTLTVDDLQENIRTNRPLILENLPSLTYLRMCETGLGMDTPKWWLTSITLRLPALESLQWEPGAIEVDVLREMDLICPSLTNLDIDMWSWMEVTPSIFSQLRSLDLNVLG